MKTKLFFLFMIITILSSEILSQNKIVTIDQRLSTNQQVGTLKKWEGSSWSNPFSPGTQFPFPLYSNQVILGDQAIYSNQKYNNWNSDFSNVKNHRSFNITPTTDLLLSNFIATNTGITIRTSLEGTSATGGVVEFRDPWFIDFQDAQFGNQLSIEKTIS